MPRNPNFTRRRFLQTSAAAGAAVAIGFPTIVPSTAFGANEKLNIAAIGAGGKGAVDLDGVSSENIIAMCDPDEQNAAAMFGRFGNAKRYKDYREMLEKEEKNIDAVTVSTPDHHHAPAALRAMRMGKHVYCQKPLTHTVQEARLMAQTAKQMKVATQMGNQGHSDSGLRRNVELIRSGILGDITEAHVWTDRPIWPQGVAERPAEQPVPATLDWNLWLGAAPVRPYNAAYAPFKWRGFWDFGTGALGDMACHCMDVVFWGLQLTAPTSVSAQQEGNTKESGPKWSIIDYNFPGFGNSKTSVKMTWYDGGKKPSPDLVKGRGLPTNGVIIVGSKDTLFIPSYWGAGEFLKTSVKETDAVPVSIPRRKEGFDRGHYMEWIEACKGGPAALSNMVDFSGPMTEALLLGNVAMRVGEKIEWDTKALKVTNNADANKLIAKEYRKGWELGPAPTA